MQINVTYDQNVSSLPAGFVAAVNYALNYLDSLFASPVTININVGYGEIDGQSLSANALGESLPAYQGTPGNVLIENYSQVRSALIAANAPGASTLPATAPTNNTLLVTAAEAKALGLLASNSGPDGYVGFNSTPNIFSYSANSAPASNQYYFIGVFEHEITEIMGRVSDLDMQGYYSVMDLFRYAAAGVRQFSTGAGSYFSIDGGNSNLDNWNNFQTGNNGDLGDWAPSAGNDAFLDNTNPGVINAFTATDITLMNALGWTGAGTGTDPGGISLGSINASLIAQGDVVNNGTTSLVWRAVNGQTTVWSVNTSDHVTTTNLGPIGFSWTVLNAGHYLSSNTTQMLTRSDPDGTMTLWWVSNGSLTGINLGQHWQNVAYVDTGTFTNFGSTDILVRNQADNHMYVWWVSNNTLQGIDLGAHWVGISYVAGGQFTSFGSDNMLVRNQVDNHMYVWWVDQSTLTLQGIDLGAHWGNVGYVASGQFTSSGSEDMLVRNQTDNHMYVWWVASNNTLQGIDLGAHWGGVQFLASGHFLGNSNDQMLVQNTVDHHVYLWWVASNNTLQGTDLGAVGSAWNVIETGNYQQDGFTDVVWQNSVTGQVELWTPNAIAQTINSHGLMTSMMATMQDAGPGLFTPYSSASVQPVQDPGEPFTLISPMSSKVVHAASPFTDPAFTREGQPQMITIGRERVA
jgi:hypothetical protein